MLNKVTLIGYVGQSPEIRSTQDGREIATFSLATSESWIDKRTGEKKQKSEWHRIVVFSQPLAKLTKNWIKKGSKIYIEGQLATRKWTDNSNIDRYTTEILLQNFGALIKILDSKNSQNSSEEETTSQDHVDSESNGDDEIPF